MKHFLLRASLFCLAAVTLMGCDEKNTGVGDFALSLKTVGADYVEISVTAPSDVEMAYVISEDSQALTPAVLFMTGKTAIVSPGSVLKITDGLFQNKDYRLYAAAKLDDRNYSRMVTLEFSTKAYEFDDLLTVVEQKYDGYKIHINVPEETKKRGNVIRYGGTSLAWFNVLKNNSGDETATILNAVVANGNRNGNYAKNDTTLIRDNTNIVQLDQNGDPVLDEYGQQIDIHDPISPGEPSVFFAGECRWGTDAEMGEIMGYYFDAPPAYIVPLFSWDKADPAFDWDNTDRDSWEGSGWTGAFQKKVFNVKEPGVCDATVNIEIPEDEITVTDAIIYFNMDEEVSRYFYMVLDNATYNQVLDVYLDGNEDWYQWFLTSYVAYYEWGIGAMTESGMANAAASFNDGALIGGETYHVLCTVMVDDPAVTDNPQNGGFQRFIHKTFEAKEKTKPAPVVEVKAVNTTNPYEATFNIKAPNKDIVGAYWACNYAREFEVMLNSNYTYESILKGNYTFPASELAKVNSDEGLDVTFNTLDGEITRFVVYGCNDEYTFNFIDEDTQGVGWADYKAPMADNDSYISSPLYDALAGEWTATARLKINEKLDDGTVVSREQPYSSKVTISRDVPGLPAQVEEYVYGLYTDMERSEVDGMFEELLDLSETFAQSRLEGQNRMLCTGFLDFDYYEKSRVEYMSPYDLFKATEYSSYDVAQLIYDFGPKWFLEVLPDGNVIVPFDSMYLPPMHAWPGYPFYVGGYGVSSDGTPYAFYDPNEKTAGFPVEIEDDYSKITIKPIVLDDGSKYYMNALGVDGQTMGSVEIVATILSEIVLEKGWNGDEDVTPAITASPVKAAAVTLDGTPVAKMPEVRVYKSMTDLKVKDTKAYKVDETPNVVTMDMVNATTEKILKHFNVR